MSVSEEAHVRLYPLQVVALYDKGIWLMGLWPKVIKIPFCLNVAVKFVVIVMKETEICCFNSYGCKHQASTGCTTISVTSVVLKFDPITKITCCDVTQCNWVQFSTSWSTCGWNWGSQTEYLERIRDAERQITSYTVKIFTRQLKTILFFFFYKLVVCPL